MATTTTTVRTSSARPHTPKAPTIKSRTIIDETKVEGPEGSMELLPRQGQQSRALICDFCTRRGTTNSVHMCGCDLAACDECHKLIGQRDVVGLAQRAVTGARLNESHYPGCTRRLIEDYTYLLNDEKSAVSA